jgi:serine/threonine protein kinase
VALPVRSILHDQYVVGRVLGSPGGFGITYLCRDIKLATRVAIKEFMSRDNAVRDTDRCSVVAHSSNDREFFEYGLKAFLSEAQTVAGFNHPNIVRVKTYFEQNHTAYLVMDYYEGVSLAEYVKRQGGRLPEKTALDIMRFVLDGLCHVHDKGYLHRDVKPANIYLTGKGQVILLDFGAARYAVGEHSRSLSVVVTPGFSPFEQYRSGGKRGVWTDIYAWGATLYYLVTGQVPLSAPDRIEEDTLPEPKQFTPNLSEQTNKAIMQALRVKASDRPQSIEELKKILGGITDDDKKKDKKDEEKKPLIPIWRRKEAIAIGACLLVFLVIAYGYWWRTGELVVDSNPGDAEIWVDGVYHGRGQVRLGSASPGKRILLAKRPGYADEEKLVEVRSGGVTNVSIHMMVLKGTLKVDTEPSGTEISVNGVVKGRSPVEVNDIKPGSVKVRAVLKNYHAQEKTVEISPGEQSRVDFVLKKEIRDLSVGVRVRRGPDWKWANQDGGADKLGTVTKSADSTGWITVKWDSGKENMYRWGADNKYDLELVLSAKSDNGDACSFLYSKYKECYPGGIDKDADECALLSAKMSVKLQDQFTTVESTAIGLLCGFACLDASLGKGLLSYPNFKREYCE